MQHYSGVQCSAAQRSVYLERVWTDGWAIGGWEWW